jgi:hypothetical protein
MFKEIKYRPDILSGLMASIIIQKLSKMPDLLLLVPENNLALRD